MRKMLIVANVSKEHVRKFHLPFIVYMKKQGWQVDVACRMDAPIPECDHTFDLPCDRNPFYGEIGKSIEILKNLLQKESYDVLVCNTITGAIIARLAARPFRKKGLKVFYINHGLHFFEGAPLSRWLLGYPVEKILAPYTDLLITINSADYQMAKKYLGLANVECICGIGVDLQRFKTCKMTRDDRNDLRRSLGIAPDDFVLTYVAEINENKNQLMLLEALHYIRQAIPNARMFLVGPEHDGGKVRKFVVRHGLSDSVFLLGWRDDVAKLLKASDVYVASSKSEGLGINLIEAMACDLPVIASKNRGHAEIIQHGINGFLVEQNDAEEMAKYVLEIATDLQLRENITDRAQIDISKYEIEQVLAELDRIFTMYA